MANILYVRVSTKEQETARQEELAEQYKIDKIFVDKLSGKNTDRPQFKAMMIYLREGDTLYVKSISRLSRSIRDLLRTVDELEEKKVKFISVKNALIRPLRRENLCLTSSAHLPNWNANKCSNVKPRG